MKDSSWTPIALGEVLTLYQDYIDAPEAREYSKLSVRLYGKGVVLDASTDGSILKMKRHQIATAGQVILSEIWGKKGAIGIVPLEGAGALCTSHFFLFDIKLDRLDPKYLQAIFTANYLEEQLGAVAKGTTGYAAVRPRHLLSATIPLPPIDEQRRIVARIEGLAAKIEEASGLRRETIEERESLLASVINHFSLPEECWYALRKVLANRKGAVRSGPFGSQLHHEEFVSSGIAAIGTRDVQVNRFALRSGWFVSPEKFEHFRRYQVFPADLLTTIVGASIGRFCIVPDDVPIAFTTKHILALSLDSSVVEPHFASLMLNYHERCRASLFSKREGSAQPSLNSTKVLATAFPVPPLADQRRIVAHLEALQAKVDTLKRLQAETAAELDALLPSVLDKAFRGEL